jgi:hypothetical protein
VGRILFAAGPPARKRYDRNPRAYIDGIDGRWTLARQDESKVIKIPHPQGPIWEAYDLAKDPLELDDLGESPDFAGLRARLLAWEEETRRVRLPHTQETGMPGREELEELQSFGYLH